MPYNARMEMLMNLIARVAETLRSADAIEVSGKIYARVAELVDAYV